MIGRYVIVRTYSAGVFAGLLAARTWNEVTLMHARRLWYWAGACSISQLSQDGPHCPEDCKFAMPVPEILLLEAIEIVPCSEVARDRIESTPVWACAQVPTGIPDCTLKHTDHPYRSGYGYGSGSGSVDGTGDGSGDAALPASSQLMDGYGGGAGSGSGSVDGTGDGSGSGDN